MSDLESSNVSEVADDNNAPAPNGLPEGQLPGSVNNSTREFMAAAKREWNRAHHTITTGGSSAALTITPTTPIASYVTGQTWGVILGSDIGANATVNVSGKGAKNVYVQTQAGLRRTLANDARSGNRVRFVYNTALNSGSGGAVMLDGPIPGGTDGTVLTAGGADEEPTFDVPLNLGAGTDSGSANAYVVTTGTARASAAGDMVRFLPAHANSGASTLNKDGDGAKAAKRYNGDDLEAGDLLTTAYAEFIDNGTEWRMAGPSEKQTSSSFATAAAASATAAAGSATAAATSASAAATSATSASGSATAASGSATAAAASAAAAAVSASAAMQAWVPLSKVAISGSPSVIDFTGLSAYKVVKLVFDEVLVVNTGSNANLGLRYSTDNGANFVTSNYTTLVNKISGTSPTQTLSRDPNSVTSAIVLNGSMTFGNSPASANGYGLSGECLISLPKGVLVDERFRASMLSGGFGGGTNLTTMGIAGESTNTAISVNALRLVALTGTSPIFMSGTVTLLGLKDF